MSKQYLYRVNILNRKNSHPLESICYYSGENQFDMVGSKQYNSNTSDNVIWNRIVVPTRDEFPVLFQNLPEYLKFRSSKKDMMSNARNILWKNVYDRESREDAQFARVFELSLPSFLTQEDAIDLLSSFAGVLVKSGMIADCSIHSKQKNINLSLLDKIKMGSNKKKVDDSEQNNLDYRGFLMCTLRDYEAGRFVNKNRSWNVKKQLEDWRENWVELLAKKIMEVDIDPQIRSGWEEKLGIYSEYEKIKKRLDLKSSLKI